MNETQTTQPAEEKPAQGAPTPEPTNLFEAEDVFALGDVFGVGTNE